MEQSYRVLVLVDGDVAYGRNVGLLGRQAEACCPRKRLTVEMAFGLLLGAGEVDNGYCAWPSLRRGLRSVNKKIGMRVRVICQ